MVQSPTVLLVIKILGILPSEILLNSFPFFFHCITARGLPMATQFDVMSFNTSLTSFKGGMVITGITITIIIVYMMRLINVRYSYS